jgi:2-succinyl-5-enolpyruvyl-6-hydroxy-3-cyclohexene-1-carboxylate synthase
VADQAAAPAGDADARERLERFLGRAGGLVAIVGGLPSSEQAPVARFLRRLGAPVWAEAVSGLREHAGLSSQLVRGGEAGVASLGVTRVLRIGGVPSLRYWRDLEGREEVAVFSLTREGFRGLARGAEVAGFPEWDRVQADPVPPVDLAADAGIASRIEAAIAAWPRSEPALVRAVAAAVPSGSMVFLGNSLPVREWDAFAGRDPRRLRCFANRGANGIDGCVSTFFGLSADEEESWCVVGDLTAVYDLAGPWVGPALPRGRRRLVVINNEGGRIFSRMDSLRELGGPARAMMENPHRLRFRGWAELWGWAYRRVASPEELVSPMAADHTMVEVVPDPAQTEAFWTALAGRPPSSHPTPPQVP